MTAAKYSVAYKDNIKPGTATVVVTAVAPATGTVTKTFTILEPEKTEENSGPMINLSSTSLTMKKGQTYKGFAVTMGKGDCIASVKSNKTNLVKVTAINKTKGTFNLKAQKKTGTAKVTITLASGLKKILTIKVQAGAVKTSKITGLKSKLTLKKGKSVTLKPTITPITSTQKVTYKTSKKKVATVTSKGVIKAKKKGTAKITVKSGNKKKVVTVTVK